MMRTFAGDGGASAELLAAGAPSSANPAFDALPNIGPPPSVGFMVGTDWPHLASQGHGLGKAGCASEGHDRAGGRWVSTLCSQAETKRKRETKMLFAR